MKTSPSRGSRFRPSWILPPGARSRPLNLPALHEDHPGRERTPKLRLLIDSRHIVVTTRLQGWSGLNNGDLLAAAEEAGFDRFITAIRKSGIKTTGSPGPQTRGACAEHEQSGRNQGAESEDCSRYQCRGSRKLRFSGYRARTRVTAGRGGPIEVNSATSSRRTAPNPRGVLYS